MAKYSSSATATPTHPAQAAKNAESRPPSRKAPMATPTIAAATSTQGRKATYSGRSISSGVLFHEAVARSRDGWRREAVGGCESALALFGGSAKVIGLGGECESRSWTHTSPHASHRK